jgi:hypothetical protein
MTAHSWNRGIAPNARSRWTAPDFITIGSVAYLILSPWMLRYSREAVPTASAVLIGVLLGIVVVAKVVRPAEWLECASLALGVWALIAPLLLGFGDDANAIGLHITLGLVATTSAALQLWVRHYENLA